MSNNSQNNSSGFGWVIFGGVALGLLLILELDAKIVATVLGPKQINTGQFIMTIIRWHSLTLWKTTTALPHPALWHIIGVAIPSVVIIAAYILFLLGHHHVKSSGIFKTFSSGGSQTSTKTSDDPAKWLPFDARKYSQFTPEAVVKRDRVRPRLKDVPLKDRRLDDYGFVVGYEGDNPNRPIAISSELSVLVTGEPRSGKTAGFVIPWISTWQGPIVTTSTRNEVLRATLMARKRVSEHVYALTLPGVGIPDGVEPISYDICWFYEDELDALIEAAERRASIFSSVAADKNQPVWENATKQLFASLLLIAFAWRHAQIAYLGNDSRSSKPSLANQSPETSHVDVLKYFAALTWTRDPNMVADVQRFLIEHIPDKKGLYVASYVGSVVRTFQGESGNTEFAQTITGMIAVGLGKLNDPQIAAVFSTPWDKPVFEPNKFLEQSGTLYIISRSEDSSDLAKFFSLVVNEIASAARRRAGDLGRCDPGLALILDELANIAPLPNLKGYMSEGGGVGITTVAIVQNLRQLVSTYGGQDKMLEIVSSANVLCIFGGAKAPEDLRIAANMAGSRITQLASYDKSGALTGRSESSQAALDANQISNMPEGWIVLKLPGVPLITVKTVYYWRYPKALQRAWRREWGEKYDPDTRSYPFHGTSRALSLNAVRDLSIESDAVTLTPFRVEPTVFLSTNVTTPPDEDGDFDGGGGTPDETRKTIVKSAVDSLVTDSAQAARATTETIAERRDKLAKERARLSQAASLDNYKLDKLDIRLFFEGKPESMKGPDDE